MQAAEAAMDAVPLSRLEDALRAGSFHQAEALLEEAFGTFEDSLQGTGRPAPRGLAAAARKTRAPDTLGSVLAGAFDAGTEVSPVCVRMPGKAEIVDAVQDYTAGSADLNDPLRSGRQLSAAALKRAEVLDAAIADKRIVGDVLLYRVSPREFSAALEEGTSFIDRGYVSTTKHRSALEGMIEDAGLTDEPLAYYTIKTPAGTPGLDVNLTLPRDRNNFPEQREMILGRGHEFVVDRIDELPGGHAMYYLRLIR